VPRHHNTLYFMVIYSSIITHIQIIDKPFTFDVIENIIPYIQLQHTVINSKSHKIYRVLLFIKLQVASCAEVLQTAVNISIIKVPYDESSRLNSVFVSYTTP